MFKKDLSTIDEWDQIASSKTKAKESTGQLIELRLLKHQTAFTNDKESILFKDQEDAAFSDHSQESPNKMKNAIRDAVLYKVVDASEYIVKFRPLIFIKFWIYHLLFFYSGFWSIPIISSIDSFALCQNMGFWPKRGMLMPFFFQLTQGLCNVAALVLFLLHWYLPKDHAIQVNLRNIYPEQLFFINFELFVRTFLIAVRYGFMAESRLKIITQAYQHHTYLK